jgi:hypothetical protein
MNQPAPIQTSVATYYQRVFAKMRNSGADLMRSAKSYLDGRTEDRTVLQGIWVAYIAACEGQPNPKDDDTTTRQCELTWSGGAIMSLVRPRRAALVLMTLGVAVSLAHAGPALLRTKNVQCDLSMDGAFVGAVGDSYFIRVTTGPGDHIVSCSGTFNLTLDQDQNSKVVPLPFAISTTVSIPDSQTQVVIDLPDPIISLEDAARLLGRGYFNAQAGISGWQEKDMVLDTDCSTNEYEAGVSGAQAETQEMIQKKGEVVVNGDNDMMDACKGSRDDCKEAQRDQRNAIDKASDKVDQAQAQFRTALGDRNRFVNALDSGNIRIYPSSMKTCGARRMVTIGFENQFLLAPPSFVIKSDQGGRFLIK